MFSKYRKFAIKRINQYRCLVKRRNHTVRPKNKSVGYLTIFHDFEADYSSLTTRDISFKGISKILNLEKSHNIYSTFNIVGKLINEIPELILRIRSEGHEIASHSYSHRIMTRLTKEQMINDLQFTKNIFNSIGLKLRGFRSPQSKWNFKLARVLLEQGIYWNAEDEKSKYPYVLIENTDGDCLLRMPVTVDDWLYQSSHIDPRKMYDLLINTVDTIAHEKSFGSIGFHPWVQGEDEQRLDIFDKFLKYITRKKGIKILTFEQIYKLCSN